MNQHPDIARYLIAKTVDKVTSYIIEDKHASTEEALDIVYNSRTISLLEDATTGLYAQSPAYVYEMMQEETF